MHRSTRSRLSSLEDLLGAFEQKATTWLGQGWEHEVLPDEFRLIPADDATLTETLVQRALSGDSSAMTAEEWHFLWGGLRTQETTCLEQLSPLLETFWSFLWTASPAPTWLPGFVFHWLEILQGPASLKVTDDPHSEEVEAANSDVEISPPEPNALPLYMSDAVKQEWVSTSLVWLKQQSNPPAHPALHGLYNWLSETEAPTCAEALLTMCIQSGPKLKHRVMPGDWLEQRQWPRYGQLSSEVAQLCVDHLLSNPWQSWEESRWYLRVAEGCVLPVRWLHLVQSLLSSLSEDVLGQSRTRLLPWLVERLGHPLSAEGDWNDVYFTQDVRRKVAHWAGARAFSAYQDFHKLLNRDGYYEELDQTRGLQSSNVVQDVYPEAERAIHRFSFWMRLQRHMEFTRFFVAPSAHQWLRKTEEGVGLLRNQSIGRYVGRKENVESNIAIMVFPKVVVLEFMYGAGNPVLMYERSEFEKHQHLFETVTLREEDLDALPIWHRLEHDYRWQVHCERFLQQEFGLVAAPERTSTSAQQRKPNRRRR